VKESPDNEQILDISFVLRDHLLWEQARNHQELSILSPTQRIICDNIYYQRKVSGSIPQIAMRSIVKMMLENALKYLPNKDYGFIIYDAFRTLEAQITLFNEFKEIIAHSNPQWDEEKVFSETKKFVPLPGAPGCPAVMPHNTGGAVDLTLSYCGRACEMGTPFDDPTERAKPDYFEGPYLVETGLTVEQWQEAKKNRRILCHALQKVGFVVHDYEWWHYDFGNRGWANRAGVKVIFSSMEHLWDAHKKNSKY
jgi:D-alanyl-D-alanine dipeptidase